MKIRLVRLLLIVSSVVVALGVQPGEASAGEIGKDKKFGIGLEFSHGPGLSLKFHPAPDHALQFGIYAFDYGQYRNYARDNGKYYYGYAYGYAGLLVHGEYLNHPGMLLRSAVLDLPWYWGGGLDLGVGAGSAAMAVHANLGLALQFKPLPIDIFFEWTPRLWLVDFVQFHPVDLNAGIRIWF